jgi:hypothetical protein
MLPSKDNDLRITHSLGGSPVDERGEAFNEVQEHGSLSWKKQAFVDLKPSGHRDT